MDDTQRTSEHGGRSEESREQEVATAIVARMLANPRRVRRD
jgi:hypothetical protein